MGILKNQLTNSTLGLKGSTPDTIAGALNTSQTHYKNKLKAQTPGHSVHDFDGQRPDTIAGALNTSQTHYNNQLKAQTPGHSIHDYDGQRPDPAYLENLPE